MTPRTLAFARIPPILAATICGWLIGYCLFRGDALAKTASAATFGLIGVYYLQLRNMFECRGTWFGDLDQAKGPAEILTPLDEEKEFLKTIEEEEEEEQEKPPTTSEMASSEGARPEAMRRGM
jgi:hypothetical protein